MPSLAQPTANGSHAWSPCLPPAAAPVGSQPAAPSPAPLPGGFKSMKNRWLAEFEAEQAAKQAAERAEGQTQQTAATDAHLTEQLVPKAEPTGDQAPAADTQLVQLARGPDAEPAAEPDPQQDAVPVQPVAKRQRNNGGGAAAKLKAGEQDAVAPDTSSAHSEADQHPRSSPAAAAHALPPHLVAALEQDAAASPASDADSTKHHSPAGGATAAAAGRPPDTAAAAEDAAAGLPGRRKRKPEGASEPGQRRRPPPQGQATRNGAPKPRHEAAAADADLPPHLRQAADSKGSGRDPPAQQPAAPRPAAALAAAVSQKLGQQPKNGAQPDQRQPANAERPDKHAGAMRNGKRLQAQPGSNHGGLQPDPGRPTAKPQPSNSEADTKRDPDLLPSEHRHGGGKPAAADRKAAVGAAAKGAGTQQQGRKKMQQRQRDGAPDGQPDASSKPEASSRRGPAQETTLREGPGGNRTAPAAVELHYLSEHSGASKVLGEVDLQACSCRAEVLKAIYARHAPSLPDQAGVRLTYEDDVGDWMLLHDGTSWNDFVTSACRLLVTSRA